MMPREATHLLTPVLHARPPHAAAAALLRRTGLMTRQATPSAPGTLRRLEPAARWFGGGARTRTG